MEAEDNAPKSWADALHGIADYDLAEPAQRARFQEDLGGIRGQLVRIDLTAKDPDEPLFPALFLAKRLINYVWSNFFTDAMFDLHEPYGWLSRQAASDTLETIQGMCGHVGDLLGAEGTPSTEACDAYAEAIRSYYRAVHLINNTSHNTGELV